MSVPSGLICLRCSTDYPAEDIVTGCEKCRAEGVAVNLKVAYAASAYRNVQGARGFDPEERGVWRYHELLPVSLAHAVWLGEGETGLIHAGALGEALGLEHLYLKNETRNPTGSYKDRMAAVIVARAARRWPRTQRWRGCVVWSSPRRGRHWRSRRRCGRSGRRWWRSRRAHSAGRS
jgi:threonine synthase